MKKDSIDALIERIDTDFGEDFKVNRNGSPGQTAHAPGTYKVNNIRPALYLNELIEDGHCLCGLPLFFSDNPWVDVSGLNHRDTEFTSVGFMLFCRRDYHNDHEFIQFHIHAGGETYLDSYIRYWWDRSRLNDDGLCREDSREIQSGRVRSAGYKKLMSLLSENHPPLSAFFEYYNKLIDTTDEYVKIRDDLLEELIR